MGRRIAPRILPGWVNCGRRRLEISWDTKHIKGLAPVKPSKAASRNLKKTKREGNEDDKVIDLGVWTRGWGGF